MHFRDFVSGVCVVGWGIRVFYGPKQKAVTEFCWRQGVEVSFLLYFHHLWLLVVTALWTIDRLAHLSSLLFFSICATPRHTLWHVCTINWDSRHVQPFCCIAAFSANSQTLCIHARGLPCACTAWHQRRLMDDSKRHAAKTSFRKWFQSNTCFFCNLTWSIDSLPCQ